MSTVPEWWPSYESAEMNAAWWHGYNKACEQEGIVGSIKLAAIGKANQNAYENGQRDMLADCIAAIEAIPEDMNSSAEWDRDYDVDETGETRNPRIWLREATAALRAIGNERMTVQASAASCHCEVPQ